MLHPPNNLVELPPFYCDQRPCGMRLTTHEVISALWANNGNVTLAAGQLRIGPDRLRRIVHRFPEIKEAWIEIREQLLDQAERNVREALDDSGDRKRQLGMAKFILGSARGRNRGWGAAPITAGPNKERSHSAAPNRGGSGFPKLVWVNPEPKGE